METRRNGLVAIVEFGPSLHLRRSEKVNSVPVTLGWGALQDFLRQKVADGKVRVLLPSSGPSISLASLRRRVENNPLGFEMPQRLDDQICVMFGTDPAANATLLSDYETIYVMSEKGPQAYEVYPPGVSRGKPAEAPVAHV